MYYMMKWRGVFRLAGVTLCEIVKVHYTIQMVSYTGNVGREYILKSLLQLPIHFSAVVRISKSSSFRDLYSSKKFLLLFPKTPEMFMIIQNANIKFSGLKNHKSCARESSFFPENSQKITQSYGKSDTHPYSNLFESIIK